MPESNTTSDTPRVRACTKTRYRNPCCHCPAGIRDVADWRWPGGGFYVAIFAGDGVGGCFCFCAAPIFAPTFFFGKFLAGTYEDKVEDALIEPPAEPTVFGGGGPGIGPSTLLGGGMGPAFALASAFLRARRCFLLVVRIRRVSACICLPSYTTHS